MATPPLPGWYGKLPSLGDFASRRLAPEFIEPWDRWLAAGLDAWRAGDAQWLDAYLAAPVRCFLLGAGLPFAVGSGCAGVLMPSVDRVGRYFPLTLITMRRPGADAPSAAWFTALEALAVAAMQEDWDVDRLDAALSTLPGEDDESAAVEWPLHGESVWWQAAASATEPALCPCDTGLPVGPAFVALFGGPLPNVSPDSPADPLEIFEP